MNTYPKLPKAFKKKWLKALRSGKYKQGQGLLKEHGEYCCLGVACVVAGRKRLANLGMIPDSEMRVPKFLRGTEAKVPNKLITLNDDKRWDFKKIATWIEKNL